MASVSSATATFLECEWEAQRHTAFLLRKGWRAEKRRRHFAVPPQSKMRFVEAQAPINLAASPYMPSRGRMLQCINSVQQACIS